MRVVIGIDALLAYRRGGEQLGISAFVVVALVFGVLVHAEQAQRFEQSEEGHKEEQCHCFSFSEEKDACSALLIGLYQNG